MFFAGLGSRSRELYSSKRSVSNLGATTHWAADFESTPRSQAQSLVSACGAFVPGIPPTRTTSTCRVTGRRAMPSRGEIRLL